MSYELNSKLTHDKIVVTIRDNIGDTVLQFTEAISAIARQLVVFCAPFDKSVTQKVPAWHLLGQSNRPSCAVSVSRRIRRCLVYLCVSFQRLQLG